MHRDTLRTKYEHRRDELQREWSRLSSQKVGAWFLTAASAFLFVSNLFGIHEARNDMLGTVTLGGVIGGGIWLHTIYRELARNSRQSEYNRTDLMELDQAPEGSTE